MCTNHPIADFFSQSPRAVRFFRWIVGFATCCDDLAARLMTVRRNDERGRSHRFECRAAALMQSPARVAQRLSIYSKQTIEPLVPAEDGYFAVHVPRGRRGLGSTENLWATPKRIRPLHVPEEVFGLYPKLFASSVCVSKLTWHGRNSDAPRWWSRRRRSFSFAS